MAGSVRLLVVEQDDVVRQGIAELARRDPAFALVGQARTADEAYRAASGGREPIEVALVSDAITYSDPKLVAALSERGTAVMVVGRAADQESMRRAMTAGARDFLVWPFTANLLRQALDDIGALNAAGSQVSPVCVIGSHGGVGKSIVALNLAIMAGRQCEEPVALVDLDLDGGSQALYCGVRPDANMGDLLRLGHAVDADAMKSVAVKVPGVPLHLFASPAEPRSWSAAGGEDLASWVERIQFAFARVFVDLPPALDERTLAVLEGARHVVLVTAAELPALTNTARLLRLLREDLAWGGDRITVVCNRVHPLMVLNPRAIQEALGTPASVQVPFDDLAARSVANGQPLGGRRSPTPFLKAMDQLTAAIWPDDRASSRGARARNRDVMRISPDVTGTAPVVHL